MNREQFSAYLNDIKAIKNRTTWLQGIGACNGKPAGELVVGDVMGWNYGSTSTVKAIVGQTAKQITVMEEAEDYNGKLTTYTRKFKKSRIVAIVVDGNFQRANVTMSELAMV